LLQDTKKENLSDGYLEWLFRKELESQKIIAIACSAGGPKALATILSKIPQDFKYPIIVAQHMALGSAEEFAHWLNIESKIPVEVVQKNKALEKGTVYICPPESDWEIKPEQKRFAVPMKSSHFYNPSCDALLSSIAQSYGEKAIGIILNGMGKDGVKGMNAIQNNGGTTIAQDEKTSVVFEMNRVAITEGAIDKVLPLDQIASEIAST
jgi:two-component system, chemotaxis family, protein-glutamate methylesterase/glutaminase